jgi:hypothetical protein
MPDHYNRYQHQDLFSATDYTNYAKDKLKTLDKFDQQEIEYVKRVISEAVKGLGEAGLDELLLKMGSVINGAENGK